MLLLLDPGLRDFLQDWRDSDTLPKPNETAFCDYIDDLLRVPVSNLGRRPPGLSDLLTEVALGSPAILALRTMAKKEIEDSTRRNLAVKVADAFWRLFNRPAVISMLIRVYGSRAESAYWRLVLKYCQDGNLQAVLDEHWHLLWENLRLGRQGRLERLQEIARSNSCRMCHRIRPGYMHAFFERRSPSLESTQELRVRTVFALRFGNIPTDDGSLSQDSVRLAFNSPFRPFVLASTSVGQEGLDFHPWCHRLVHWDLPGNPVDLEQREGRIHRYKGHAVRRNVAEAHGTAALESWQFGDDVWARIFDLADASARAAGQNHLVPHWIAPGRFRVERHVPLLPYTREVEIFQRLKRQLAAYRVVFGQPRQEELLTLLDQAGFDADQLSEWAIDLSPPGTSEKV